MAKLQRNTYSSTKDNAKHGTEEIVLMLSHYHTNDYGTFASLAMTDNTMASANQMAVLDLEPKQPYRALCQLSRTTDVKGFTSTRIKAVLSAEKISVAEFVALCRDNITEISYTHVENPAYAAQNIND